MASQKPLLQSQIGVKALFMANRSTVERELFSGWGVGGMAHLTFTCVVHDREKHRVPTNLPFSPVLGQLFFFTLALPSIKTKLQYKKDSSVGLQVGGAPPSWRPNLGVSCPPVPGCAKTQLKKESTLHSVRSKRVQMSFNAPAVQEKVPNVIEPNVKYFSSSNILTCSSIEKT